MNTKIPIIDIFAGPGGLGEGFSAFKPDSKYGFKIALSIEKESFAHQTLTLRSFFRQFQDEEVPEEYYQYLRGELDKEVLFNKFPMEAKLAQDEAWNATLGDPKFPAKNIDAKIDAALKGKGEWVLIGGPPCQAYSLAGRSRMAQEQERHRSDIKHFLYEEYLRIIKVHKPALFVMENVKGLLSAVVPDEEKGSMFERILEDLKRPGYKIYSLSTKPETLKDGIPVYAEGSDFLIKSEKYGIPQSRHRVILLGIRNDIDVHPDILSEIQKPVSIRKAIGDLPKIRSKISARDSKDSFEAWSKAISEFPGINDLGTKLRSIIRAKLKNLTHENTGKLFYRFNNQNINTNPLKEWYFDARIGGACNHEARSHMRSDLHRYFFASCYALLNKKSPSLNEFPEHLYPKHENVTENDGDIIFADRFRVQVKNRPSTTVVSHISKDGHYYIHYDPTQARSLTVREAARLQTFPDNYFFEGPRTSQYQQVGNAVPPLLASKIAVIVYAVMEKAVKRVNA